MDGRFACAKFAGDGKIEAKVLGVGKAAPTGPLSGAQD
jgi:hypothetical protein